MSVFDRPLRRLTVEFEIHRYTAPKGTFTSDGSIWRLVTGPLPDGATTLRLADNGFRAAIGLGSDRPVVREFLGHIGDLRSAVDHARPDASRQVELDLGACPTRQVVFYYCRDGSLRGLEFVGARAKLMLAFEMRSVNLHEVWLELVPVIEEPPGPLKWVITEQGARQVPERRRTSFDDLAFGANIPENGFLLLGPTGAADDRPLVAEPFFTQAAGGRVDDSAGLRESIYVISPIIRSYTRGRTEREGGSW